MISIEDYKKRVDDTVSFLKEKMKQAPSVVIILGTGLGGLVDSIEVDTLLPYEKVPNFPRSTVEGHRGNLILGNLNGKDVAVLQGRFHYYEGYSMQQITFPF